MRSDHEIAGVVGSGLEFSPYLHGAKPEIAVRDGVVVLTGTVLDAKQKAEAETIALKSDPDVKRVENLLEIKAMAQDSLMAIQVASSHNLQLMPAVKEALLQHPWLDVTGINVSAAKGREGIFHLTGVIPNGDHQAAAEVAASAVPGVKYVVNELEVGEVKEVGNIAPDQASKADPRVCSSLMEKYATDSRNLITISDIKMALLGHPVLDATDISVKIASGCADGVFILEGTVTSSEQKQMAQAATTAINGVQYIDNKLTVR